MKTSDVSNCLALVMKHKAYYSLDLDRIIGIKRTPAVMDGCNVLNEKSISGKEFECYCVGKGGAKS